MAVRRYAWLTNAVTSDRLRHRLLLLSGMAGFLVCAFAVPQAYGRDGLAFGVAYLAVAVLHASAYARGASRSELVAILRIVPFNLAAAVLVLVGGGLRGDAQWGLWASAAVLIWLSPSLTSLEGFIVSAGHFVERHGLVVIVALGESIVVIGAGAKGFRLDAELVLAALLSLALSVVLWWHYFDSEVEVERRLREAPPEQRPLLALGGFGYWHYGLLLGVVTLAAGLKKALASAYAPLEPWVAVELAVGTALFLACNAGFRRRLGVAGSRFGAGAAAVALASIPVGTEVGAAAEVGALAALGTGAVVAAATAASTPARASAA